MVNDICTYNKNDDKNQETNFSKINRRIMFTKIRKMKATNENRNEISENDEFENDMK